jgi:hypothetical protein
MHEGKLCRAENVCLETIMRSGQMKRHLWRLLPAILAVLLAACGSGGGTVNNGGGSSSNTTNGSGTKLTLIGKVAGIFAQDFACTNDFGEFKGDASGQLEDDSSGTLWLVQVLLNNTTAAGTYNTSDAADVTLTQGTGDAYDSNDTTGDSGSVTLNPNLKTGTVNATLTLKSSGSSVHISGNFTCNS